MDKQDPAVSVCFQVSIDQEELGVFNSCEGLGAEIVIEQREEGGNNGMVWQLPTRMKFSNVKLSRPICEDSKQLTTWFASMINGVTPTTMVISAMTMDDRVVASWSLEGVFPVRWTGPDFAAGNDDPLTEELEVAHHGFRSSNASG